MKPSFLRKLLVEYIHLEGENIPFILELLIVLSLVIIVRLISIICIKEVNTKELEI